VAGDESRASNPLVADFVALSWKLEWLGFVYYKGVVVVIELADYS
jgi:hypothetical protein